MAKPMAVAQSKREAQNERKHDADNADGHVLAIHVGLGAFLDCRGDFLHAGVAGRLLENPLCRDHSEQDGETAGTDREPQG